MKLNQEIVNQLRGVIMLNWSYLSTEIECTTTGQALRECLIPARLRAIARNEKAAVLIEKLYRQYTAENVVKYLTTYFKLV